MLNRPDLCHVLSTIQLLRDSMHHNLELQLLPALDKVHLETRGG